MVEISHHIKDKKSGGSKGFFQKTVAIFMNVPLLICCLLQKCLPSCTPLHNAAGKGHMEIVDILLSHGADVHIR